MHRATASAVGERHASFLHRFVIAGHALAFVSTGWVVVVGMDCIDSDDLADSTGSPAIRPPLSPTLRCRFGLLVGHVLLHPDSPSGIVAGMDCSFRLHGVLHPVVCQSVSRNDPSLSITGNHRRADCWNGD